MPNFYDYQPEPSKEDFERAQSDIKRERAENGYGRGYYDYTPEPTAQEVWERMERNRKPFPC